jgi:hypothetical protein
MAIQGKKWCHLDLRHIQKLGIIGLVSLNLGVWVFPVKGQPPIQPVCISISPQQPQQSPPTTPQHQCCQSSAKGQCLNWQQLFPEPERTQPQSFKRPSPKPADLFTPRLDEFGNSIGSEGAAKDAVIQVGVTKALDALAPQLKSFDSSSKTGHHLNFFQRIRKDYERILGPRELKSGAILTPQIGMNMDLGRFNMDSMKLGVEIKF